MGKRVYEIAKELGVEAKQVVQRLKESGVVVKDHLATLTKEEEDKARKLFETPRAGEVQVKKMEGGRVVRRRAGGDAAPVASATAAQPAPEPEPAPAPAEEAPVAVSSVEEQPVAEAAVAEAGETKPAPASEPGPAEAAPAPVAESPAQTPA
ncbi:MAG TPA: translation initiation factor IF-2 N-terminal domain-containing protein, partial [Myxococcota bacterium]|nr:translation initiation factor IF-2 N-terminal domain-containing protein [Myxococcota bacterium]